MTDQQRLRDALEQAVPAPPSGVWHGAVVRARARHSRRRLLTVSVGLVATAMVAGLAIWATQHQDSGLDVSGSGAATCHELVRQVGAERVDDVRVVDGVTASRWLSRVATQIDPATYRDDGRVTVCVTARRTSYATYVVSESGTVSPVGRGEFNGKHGVVATMRALDLLRTDGRAITDEPFSCSTDSTSPDLGVSSTLPSGADAVLLCSDGNFYTPSRALTSGVDELVRDINDGPLSYTPPNFTCSPYAGAYDYSFVFRYPTGTRTVTYDPCRGMELGQFTRSVPLTLDRTFLSLLAQQEGASPAMVDPEPCSGARATRPTGVGDLRRIVAARYCAAGVSGPGQLLAGGRLRTMRLWGHRLMDASTGPEGRCAAPAAGRPQIQLTDAWGNTFTMTILQCRAYGRDRHLGAVLSPAGSHRVTYPLSENDRDFTRLLRQLALRP